MYQIIELLYPVDNSDYRFFKLMIIWRYLLSQYIKVLTLSTFAFIAVILTTRLDDIAHFASLGAEGIQVLLFTFHQIPYILPIVIPISALISSLILIQRLSSSHELTALRASGLSIKMILAPILIFSAYLSVFNFYIVSEIATTSHLTANSLKDEIRQLNPLLILHNKHMMRMKGIFFDSFGESKIGESASDVVVAMPGKKNHAIQLMVAKNLSSKNATFSGSNVTYITPIKNKKDETFDELMIENMGESITSVEDFSKMLDKRIFKINNDHLNLKLLLTKIEEDKINIEHSKGTLPEEQLKALRRNLTRDYTEIMRRFSIALAVFSFTLMGLSLGATIGRTRSNRSMFYLIGLAAFYLACFFVAKSIDYQMSASFILYTVPHFIIIAFSLINLMKLSKGME